MSRSVRRRRKRARERPGVASRPVVASPPIPRLFVLQMRLCAWLFPIAFCVGAWIGLAYGLDERSLGHDSKTWPIATGTVTAAEVDMVAGHYSAHYDPQVTYAYAVNGKSYVGHALRAGGYSSSSEEVAKYFLAQYPVGSLVSVRYDPNHPSRAVLEPGGGEDWWLYAGAGAASGLVGVVLVIRTARDEWQRLTYARTERERPLASPGSSDRVRS